MSQQPFDAGGYLAPGMVYIANRGTKPKRVLANGAWHHIGYTTAGPQRELIWRLNQRLRGKDPGRPINWKGLR